MQTETRAVGGCTADRDGMASAGLVITCEHGGNRIPEPYRDLFHGHQVLPIAEQGRVIHLSSHSFTPELDGMLRNADIGLPYDPARPGEADLCERWKAALNIRAPALGVRRNYPYAGKGDGLTARFRRCFPPDVYVGIELGINQKHVIRAGRHWAALRKLIVKSLRGALASRCAGDFHVADPIPQQPRLPEFAPC
jgi:predicted N-formylglutamate amidohydrolase